MCCVLFVVLCIVCCVSQYCVVPTIKCKFFQQILIFFHKRKIYFVKIIIIFSSDVGFSMSACSVQLMWPSLWWSRCVFEAVTPSFRWPDLAVFPLAVGDHGHVMQQTIKILFTNRFSQFLLQKIQQSADYNHT